MQITIRTRTGFSVSSDFMSRDELIEKSGMTGAQVDAEMENMFKMFKEFERLTNITLAVNGKPMVFNPKYIEWWTVSGLEEFGIEL